MRLNEILAINLRALMDNRDDLGTQQSIRDKAAKLGYRLSQSSVQRILAREVHTSLDIVEQLAEVYGVQPLDLMRIAKSASGQTTIPPSYDEQKLLIAWRQLRDDDKHKVMAYIAVANIDRRAKPNDNNELQLDKAQSLPSNMEAAARRASGKMTESVTNVSVTTNHAEAKGNQESGSRPSARKKPTKHAAR